MIIHPARPDDREQIIALINQVAEERRYLQTICYQPNAAWEKLLQTGGDFQAGMCLRILAERGKIIGVGRVFADGQNSPRRPAGSVGLMLAPAWRGRGWGTQLLANLLAGAQQMGYAYLRAEILQCNRPSLRLFQKFGFMVTHYHKLLWMATQDWVNEVTVERCLSGSAGLCGSVNSDGVNAAFSNNEKVY